MAMPGQTEVGNKTKTCLQKNSDDLSLADIEPVYRLILHSYKRHNENKTLRPKLIGFHRKINLHVALHPSDPNMQIFSVTTSYQVLLLVCAENVRGQKRSTRLPSDATLTAYS